MSNLKTSILAILIVLTSKTYAQPVVLTERNVDFMHVVSIDKVSGNIATQFRTNLKLLLGGGTNGDVNNDGVIVSRANNKIIRTTKQNVSFSDIPSFQSTFYDPKFSTRNQLLSFWDNEGEYHRTLKYYDIEQNKVVYTYQFNSSAPNCIGQTKLSTDGSTVAMVIGFDLVIFDFIENKFIKSAVYERRSGNGLSISNDGKRIFYNVRLDVDQLTPTLVYIEKTVSGWSDEKFIDLPPILVEENELPRIKAGIANNGNTIITRTDVVNRSQTHVISIMHDKNGTWSELENVGEFTIEFIPSGKATGGYFVYDSKIYNSEDGRVIAVQQPRRIQIYEERVDTYDVLLFIKDNTGQWNKHQVNPPEVGADGISDILLSPDGNKLYWVPTESVSGIPGAVNMGN